MDWTKIAPKDIASVLRAGQQVLFEYRHGASDSFTLGLIENEEGQRELATHGPYLDCDPPSLRPADSATIAIYNTAVAVGQGDWYRPSTFEEQVDRYLFPVEAGTFEHSLITGECLTRFTATERLVVVWASKDAYALVIPCDRYAPEIRRWEPGSSGCLQLDLGELLDTYGRHGWYVEKRHIKREVA